MNNMHIKWRLMMLTITKSYVMTLTQAQAEALHSIYVIHTPPNNKSVAGKNKCLLWLCSGERCGDF